MQTYEASKCNVFCKTKEAYDYLSNFCGGYPISLRGIGEHRIFRTSEALYQACRFPDHPKLQEEILNLRSPMGAKMVAKANKDKTRPDWDDVRVAIMTWTVQHKVLSNESFRLKLRDAQDKPIVEKSHKDEFWGAVERSAGLLRGVNQLGKILDSIDTTITEPTVFFPGLVLFGNASDKWGTPL